MFSSIRAWIFPQASAPGDIHDPNAFVAAFGSLSDRQWLRTLLSSIRKPVQRGLALPGFPPATVQRNFVGSADDAALREAARFYAIVKKYCGELDVPLRGTSRVLDFGVGWGRILRFFLKDVAVSGLYGADVDADVLDTCRAIGVRGTLFQTQATGRLEYPDGYFDVVYAYSVFSHLSEAAHLFWIEELARVLRPGGILIVTTEARHFFEFCASLQGKPPESGWHRSLAAAFPDPAAAMRQYDAGHFVYAPTGGGDFRDASFYGEAAIPRAYVERVWTKFLDLRCFIDDRKLFWQALIVMQAR